MIDRPNTLPWPPIILAGVIAAGLILQRFQPLPWIDGGWRYGLAALGAVFGLAAIGVDLAAFKTFRDHRTTIMPHRGARALITSGIFARSRNPIYAGNLLIIAGAALLLGNLWLFAGVPVAAALIVKLAIEREERHLAAKFGAAWDSYAAQTPRWFRF